MAGDIKTAVEAKTGLPLDSFCRGASFCQLPAFGAWQNLEAAQVACIIELHALSCEHLL